MIKLQQVDLRNKRVLLRADLNVSFENGKISSEQRILASLDSVRYALEANASVLVVSHLGRPKEGQFDARYSLAPIKESMQNLLGRKVALHSDWIDGVRIEPGEVALGENVRFLSGELTCDRHLSLKLARLCDVFIMDAFGAAHRNHASVSGVVEIAPTACVGLQCQKEMENLDRALNQPLKPAVAILGGAKIQGKLQALRTLSKMAQTLIVGGGIANTFLAASGFNVGNSLYEPELMDEARNIMDIAKQNGCEIPLPGDVVVAPSLNDGHQAECKNVEAVTSQDMIFDIGPDTRNSYSEIIADSRTVIWNGPVGAFEFLPFDVGTRALTEAVVESSAFSVAGGGDTLAALERFRCMDKVSYASTGGGAFLEYIQGSALPAFAALQKHAEQVSLQHVSAV